MDAIIHVLRCFDDENVVHVDGSVNPVRDKEIIDAELQLKDLETVEARIQKCEKAAKAGGDKFAKLQLEVLVKYREALSQGKNARTVELENKEQEAAAKDLFLLTNKPVMYVCNVDEGSAVTGNAYVEQVREAQMFLEEIGLEESGVNRLIKAAYALLKLRTFLTAGSDEVRAWTFREGMKAPQCAGVIHTDFERGFIRAEVIKYEDFVALGGEAQCRAAGKLGIEGKDYLVQDAEISCTFCSMYKQKAQFKILDL